MKFFAAFLLLVVTSVFAEPTINISGIYRCVGENFLNNTIFDEPTWVVKSGEIYFFIWKNKDIEFNGTAIVIDRTVSAIFWVKNRNETPGVTTYQILPNGDLKGKWTVKEGLKTGNEYCKKIK